MTNLQPRRSTRSPSAVEQTNSAGRVASSPGPSRPAPTFISVPPGHDEPCDGPTVAELARQAAKRPAGADVYQLAINARVARAQARAREYGPDFPAIA